MVAIHQRWKDVGTILRVDDVEVVQLTEQAGRYDPATQRLRVGTGEIENVTPRMWHYDVSGVNVLRKWFSYRRRTRDRPMMGDRRVSPLMQIQSSTWRAEYTFDLIDLLHVLGLLEELEPRQAELLEAILAGPLLSQDDLEDAGVRRQKNQPAKRTPSKAPDPGMEPLFDS